MDPQVRAACRLALPSSSSAVRREKARSRARKLGRLFRRRRAEKHRESQEVTVVSRERYLAWRRSAPLATALFPSSDSDSSSSDGVMDVDSDSPRGLHPWMQLRRRRKCKRRRAMGKHLLLQQAEARAARRRPPTPAQRAPWRGAPLTALKLPAAVVPHEFEPQEAQPAADVDSDGDIEMTRMPIDVSVDVGAKAEDEAMSAAEPVEDEEREIADAAEEDTGDSSDPEGSPKVMPSYQVAPVHVTQTPLSEAAFLDFGDDDPPLQRYRSESAPYARREFFMPPSVPRSPSSYRENPYAPREFDNISDPESDWDASVDSTSTKTPRQLEIVGSTQQELSRALNKAMVEMGLEHGTSQLTMDPEDVRLLMEAHVDKPDIPRLKQMQSDMQLDLSSSDDDDSLYQRSPSGCSPVMMPWAHSADRFQ